ncbi:MAG: DUF5591 domain-containing protein [Candidatus Methanomethylophilaceae archaeon]|nr:DUF5591 domain-containing protein [Candidatus Methanomethylophilaceae archaeon]
MLDVNARSFRGRLREYTAGNRYIITPAVLRTVPEGEDGDCIVAGAGGRVLRFMGNEIPLDRIVMSTASSGLENAPVIVGNVALVSLPLPEKLEFPEDVEAVIVPNAFDLRSNARMLVDQVIKLRTAAGYNRLVGMFGIADPSTLALLCYMGIDIFDDSVAAASGLSGIRMFPEGEVDVGTPVDEDNREEMVRECFKVSAFIEGGRLRELVDQRSSSSPVSVAVLRLFDDIGYQYQEETVDDVGRRFSCNTVQALRRPDVLKYRKAILDRYEKPAHKRVLVLLPCTAKKPYHSSKTHKKFGSAIHASNYETVVHEVIVTSPLGAVPRELDSFYPANAYDIPVTGEWKCEEKAFIRELVKYIIDQGYDTVISHLGEDTELVRGLCPNMIETVVGDPTSPVSLTNLETALRESTKGMELGNYYQDRRECVKSILRFQFGKAVADRIMDDDTYAIGKYPYWKLLRNKVQLGMISEERGMFSLTLDGAKILAECGCATVSMMDFELKGNLFAVGVTDADPSIRIGDEAVVLKNGEVIGVGVAMMSGREMADLKRGIAVKIRHKAKQ